MSNFDPRHHPRRPDGKFVERPTAAAPDPDLVADLADRPLPPDPLAATFTRTVTVDRTIHVPETGHDIDIPAGLEPVDDSVFVGDGRRGHGWTRVAWVVDDPDTDDPVLADEGAECWDVRHDRRHAEGLESACWNVAAYAESRGVDPGRVFPIRSSSRAEGTTWEVIDPDEDGRAHNADGLYVVPEDVDPDARAAYAAGAMVDRTAWSHGRCYGIASVDIGPDGRPDGAIEVTGGWLDTGRDGDETAQSEARSLAGRPLGFQERR